MAEGGRDPQESAKQQLKDYITAVAGDDEALRQSGDKLIGQFDTEEPINVQLPSTDLASLKMFRAMMLAQKIHTDLAHGLQADAVGSRSTKDLAANRAIILRTYGRGHGHSELYQQIARSGLSALSQNA